MSACGRREPTEAESKEAARQEKSLEAIEEWLGVEDRRGKQEGAVAPIVEAQEKSAAAEHYFVFVDQPVDRLQPHSRALLVKSQLLI
jgi:hypothetical protein